MIDFRLFRVQTLDYSEIAAPATFPGRENRHRRLAIPSVDARFLIVIAL